MTGRRVALADAVRRPLPLACHPPYRFYEGGSLTRAFPGLPQRPDDWWSKDWVGSCTVANNPGLNGRPQGLSEARLVHPGRERDRTQRADRPHRPRLKGEQERDPHAAAR